MTYGTNAPLGLVPYRYQSGAPWTGGTTPYLIASGYATSIFKGDPVTLGTNGTLNIGVAGSAIIGVFWGVTWVATTGIAPVTPSNYWPASTTTFGSVAAVALVVDSPEVIFSIQETNGSGVAGTALTQTNVGQNFNVLVGSGTTATGISTTSLNNASGNPGSDSTLNLKIIGYDPSVANPAIGTAFQNWLVRINNHKYLGGTGTVGHS